MTDRADGSERILTQRELNRALLARQLLLERARLSVPRALERVGGLQTQYAPSGYVGLWSRLDGFARADLTRALERRTAVQGTLMRSTIHLVSARDYPLLAAGVRDARRQWWLKTHARRADARAIVETARRVRELLADGPLSQAELVKRLGPAAWNGVGLWIDLLRAPPSGTWEHRRADLYADAEQWLGRAEASEEAGIQLLVRRYLGAFGPAAVRDVASWAGLPPASVQRALAGMRLRRFRGEDGAELVDLPRAPLPDRDTPAPVRFLPVWDAALLVHARRTGILPEPLRPRVFSTRTPHSVGTFLVDGAVAGSWRMERGRIQLEPFVRLSREARRKLDAEAERLTAFHA
jgi:hypothetical protein